MSIVSTHKANIGDAEYLTALAFSQNVSSPQPGFMEFSTAHFFQLVADAKEKTVITRHGISLSCTFLVVCDE
jgi:hypothetical protein